MLAPASSWRRASAWLPAVVMLVPLALASPAAAQTRANPVRIAIDGTDWRRGILHAQLTFAVTPGPQTFYFPKWIPGTHRPEGNTAELAGLFFRAGGRDLAWSRDTLDYYTFHCDVPAGAKTLEVKLDALDVPNATDLGFFEWNEVVLYPAGPAVSQLWYRASVKLPAGWTCATALDSAGVSAGAVEYAPTTLEMLVDSPVLAGSHVRWLDLGTLQGARVDAAVYCSSVEGLDFKPEFEKQLRGMVTAADTLFGARHFDHYRFLIGLGDLVGDLTVEHHQCHIYTAKERDVVDQASPPLALNNLAHEFTHSWCGKYRRPVGLTFHDYQHAENAELLWVYEGLDQYLGYVVNARSHQFTETGGRLQFIRSAAAMAYRPGRAWRPLRDTAIDSGPLRDAGMAWSSWRRSQDYYFEGALIWLEADGIIRRLSHDTKSLDDFCKVFLGRPNTGAQVNPYTETQVVAALQSVQPYAWRQFLDERVDRVATDEPERALEAVGWRLAFVDTLDEYEKAAEAFNKSTNLGYSLGVSMRGDGTISDVRPDGPAAKAGVAIDMKIIGVNGRTFSKEAIVDELKKGKKSGHPLELLVTWGDHYRTLAVDYHGGPRYPGAERIKGQPDYLSRILHAKPVD